MCHIYIGTDLAPVAGTRLMSPTFSSANRLVLKSVTCAGNCWLNPGSIEGVSMPTPTTHSSSDSSWAAAAPIPVKQTLAGSDDRLTAGVRLADV